MVMKIDGELVKCLRREQGWSQEQLAEVSGISLRTIQRIENAGVCSLDSRSALACVFERSSLELAVKDEVGSLNHVFHGFITAFNNLDYETFVSFFSDQATVFNPLGAKTLTVAEAFFDIFNKANAGEINRSLLRCAPEGVTIQEHGEVALLTFFYHQITGFNQRTLFCVRNNGVWQVAHYHGSFVLPVGNGEVSEVVDVVPSLLANLLGNKATTVD